MLNNYNKNTKVFTIVPDTYTEFNGNKYKTWFFSIPGSAEDSIESYVTVVERKLDDDLDKAYQTTEDAKNALYRQAAAVDCQIGFYVDKDDTVEDVIRGYLDGAEYFNLDFFLEHLHDLYNK